MRYPGRTLAQTWPELWGSCSISLTADLTHCLPDSRINMQAGLGIAGSAEPSSAVTLSAPEKVRMAFLAGHPDQAYFLISESEQEPTTGLPISKRTSQRFRSRTVTSTITSWQRD